MRLPPLANRRSATAQEIRRQLDSRLVRRFNRPGFGIRAKLITATTARLLAPAAQRGHCSPAPDRNAGLDKPGHHEYQHRRLRVLRAGSLPAHAHAHAHSAAGGPLPSGRRRLGTTNRDRQPLPPDRDMASDEAYMDFLDKANQDPGEGYAKVQGETQTKREFKATDGGVEVPEVLSRAVRDSVYSSEADEPFVPVALAFTGGSLPDEEEFAKLIDHWDPKEAKVEIMDPVDWDTEGQYKDVIEAVRKASKGNDVRVYRVAKEGARAEYWVVTRDGERLLGAKALAVES